VHESGKVERDQRGTSVGLAAGRRETPVGEKGHGLGKPGLDRNPTGNTGEGERAVTGESWPGIDPGWVDCGGRRQGGEGERAVTGESWLAMTGRVAAGCDGRNRGEAR
jgi:hypothetical protein